MIKTPDGRITLYGKAMIRRNYFITQPQAEWLAKQAAHQMVSEAQFIRDIIDQAMELEEEEAAE